MTPLSPWREGWHASALVQGLCKCSELMRIQQCSSHVMAGYTGFPYILYSPFLMRFLTLGWGDVDVWFSKFFNFYVFGSSSWDNILVDSFGDSPLSSLPPVACGGFWETPWSAQDLCLERFCSDSQCSRLRGWKYLTLYLMREVWQASLPL